MNPAEKIIVALDNESVGESIALFSSLKGTVYRFKVGHQQIFDRNFSMLLDTILIHKMGLFIDLKLYDTPDTVYRTVKRAGERGVEFITLYNDVDVIDAANRARGSSSIKLICVEKLTSKLAISPEILPRSFNTDGVICPPSYLSFIRPFTEQLLITPGIRIPRPGYSILHPDNHSHVVTPKQAIDAGADYIVIGRSITKAKDPLKTVEDIISSLT
jgi:orotidine-5'-phosphate decarboxylase